MGSDLQITCGVPRSRIGVVAAPTRSHSSDCAQAVIGVMHPNVCGQPAAKDVVICGGKNISAVVIAREPVSHRLRDEHVLRRTVSTTARRARGTPVVSGLTQARSAAVARSGSGLAARVGRQDHHRTLRLRDHLRGDATEQHRPWGTVATRSQHD